VLLASTATIVFGGEADLGKARDAIAHGRYAEGLKSLEAILAKASGKTERDARALRVRAYLETGGYKKAVAEAARLERLAPEDPDALALHALALLETGRYEEAGKLLARALKLDKAHLKARVLSLVLGEITGNDDAVDAQVSYFFNLYNDNRAKSAEALAAVGRAVGREDPHGAWQAYEEAQKADPNHIEAYVRAGFHCFSKYAWDLARENFDKALKLNPKLAVAHVGIGAVRLADSKYGKALKSIEAALKVDPNLGLAHLLKASLLAAEQKHEESLAEIRAALKVNPRDPDALSLLAAHHEALGNAGERDKAVGQVHKINPKNADVYTTLALANERLRRCPAAIAWARKAIKLDPKYWRGYYLAAMNLLRAGEEKEGYKLLERAFDLNSFNIWAYNMLTVLDRDLKDKEFVYHQTPHFFIKLDKSEDAILWPYLGPLLESMYERLTRKYGFKPAGPKQYGGRILVLMFPKHEEFSARTVGLPGLGALGACLGQVITMPSPRFGRMRPGGAFNWKLVITHEFVHVLTLQKTRYKIPRWLTEGLSVWEEQDTRIRWDLLLVRALARNELLPLEDLNAGFNRPKSRTQVPLSYYQAFLICRHLEEAYGFGAIAKMLDMYRDGRQTAQVLPKVTGKSIEQLNKETLAYIRRYAEQIKLYPPVDKKALAKLEEKAKKDDKNADLWTRIAAGRLAAGRADDARKAAKRAVELSPKLARAHGILGHIAYAIDKEPKAAKEHCLRAKKADPNYFFARLCLGLIAEAEGAAEAAIAELEAARKIAPRFQAPGKSPHQHLAELYVKAGKPKKAIEVLRELTRLATSNHRAFVRLGELLAKQGQPAEAAAAYLEAIYIDPFAPQTHLAAARAYEAAKAPAEAAREYGVAAAIEPKNLVALVGRARALAAAGQVEAAGKAIDAVRKIDPKNAEAAKIEKSLKK